MSRKAKTPIRDVLADPVFNSKIITKLINATMLDGKKSVAESIIYNAFNIIKTKTNKDPLEVFNAALENVLPQLEVRSRRVGGSNYQVPVEVSTKRKQTLALRWIIQYARLRNEKTMEEKLAGEIIDASNKIGGACKKRDDTHKMAESNKAFAHLRW